MKDTRNYSDIQFTVVSWPCEIAPGHVREFLAYEVAGNLTDENKTPLYGDSFSENIEDAEVFLRGSVKWDGCSNWDFPGLEDVMMHFCSVQDAKNLGILFERIYGIAEELIPNSDFD